MILHATGIWEMMSRYLTKIFSFLTVYEYIAHRVYCSSGKASPRYEGRKCQPLGRIEGGRVQTKSNGSGKRDHRDTPSPS
jgi:hypothetical protein